MPRRWGRSSRTAKTASSLTDDGLWGAGGRKQLPLPCSLPALTCLSSGQETRICAFPAGTISLQAERRVTKIPDLWYVSIDSSHMVYYGIKPLISFRASGSFLGMGMRDENQDQLLVQECLAGSEAAWNSFTPRFVGLIRSVVRRQAGLSPADVEDFTQSTFLALATSLNNYDSRHSLARFVCVVTERSNR